MMERHPNSLLMVRPAKFGHNPETAIDNVFQNNTLGPDSARHATYEFDQMAATLQAQDIATLVVQDTPTPPTPDSIFPNNWISFHPDNSIVLYPMYAANRRNETTKAILPAITDALTYTHVTDLRSEAPMNDF